MMHLAGTTIQLLEATKKLMSAVSRTTRAFGSRLKQSTKFAILTGKTSALGVVTSKTRLSTIKPPHTERVAGFTKVG